MNIGGGETIISPDGNSKNGDNGQSKSSNKLSGLPQQILSCSGNGNKSRMPPEIHSAGSSSSRTFENKENMPSNVTSDVILSTSSKEHLGAMLKSAMKTLDSDNGFQHQPVYATSDLHNRESISCGIEESTEVIYNFSSFNENHFGTGRASPGTDSDVEILTPEEIAESESSASGIVSAMNPLQICSTEKEMDQKQSVESKLEKGDQEIIVVDSIYGSLTSKDIPRLLKVIGEQTVKIEMLQSTIDRYLERHKTLFKHVEALRLALDIKDTEITIVKSGVNPNDKL